MDTATAVARLRATESERPAAEQLFADPFAHLFARFGDEASDRVTESFVSLPFMREQVRLRTRYIDDVVRDGLADGARQVVLLGAGFDCRALRLPEIARAGATVFEVDLAEQVERKRTTLAAAGVALPPALHHVACDLAAPDYPALLRGEIARRGFRAAESSVFVWEGVLGYIDDRAVALGLGFVATVGAPRSRLTFNHTTVRFPEGRLAGLIETAGLRLVEEIDLATVFRRYLPGEPPPGGELFRIATAEVV